ncbi:MAG: nitroreductase family protein [Candidatus Aminicenantes bacterium]
MNHEKIKPTAFLQLAAKRKSIRRFNDRPVDKRDVITCLEAARLAPSAENAQPWRFLVMDDPEIKSRFADHVFTGVYKVSRFAAKAPVLILIMARLNIITHRLGRWYQDIPFHLIDTGIAGEHLVLQAEELGIGTCWMGWFNVRKARKFFKIPGKYKITALIALGGYDKKPSRERKRKPLEEIVWFNRMGEAD